MMTRVLVVPVYIPSYDQSGDTYQVAVGSRVSWQLAVADGYLPEHLLATITATAEPAAPGYPPMAYYPTLLRQGGLTAWWDPGRPVSGTVTLQAWFALNDTRIDPEQMPTSAGEVVRLYWALGLLRQRPDGPCEPLPALGLAEVESTEVDSVKSFSAHFSVPGVNENDGRWRHIGWLAEVQIADDSADMTPE